MEKGKVIQVYPGGNTPAGFHSFYREGLSEMSRIFILKGGPGTGKSTVMRKIGIDMTERGYDVELWQCSSDNDSLDGVIIKDLGVAVVDGTAPHVVDPVYPGVVDEIVNLGDYWDREMLADHATAIKTIIHENGRFFELCYSSLREAEAMWLNNYAEVSGINEAEIQGLYEDIFDISKVGVRNFFASAFTPRGWVGYIDGISNQVNRRYILTGNSNLASSIMAGIMQEAHAKCHEVEVYHNPLIPANIEVLVIKSLGIALIDAGALGVEVQADDIVVEVSSAVDENGWREKIGEATENVREAKVLHDKLESYYIAAMDFAGIDGVAYDLFNKIWQIASQKEKAEK